MKGKKLTSRILSILLCIFMIINNISILDVNAATAKKTTSNVSVRSTATLQVGQSTFINVKKSSGVTIKKVTYSSNKKSIVTVTSKGKITAKKVGKAYIYSTVKYVKNKKAYTTKLKTTVVVKKCSHKKFVTIKNVKPTCTKSGKKQVKCKQCGYVKTTTIKATGHKYDKGTIVKIATCKTTGTKVYICTICKHKKSVVIPKTTTHKWNSEYTIDKQPTKTAEGSKSIHCSVCNTIKSGSLVKIPKLAECNHIYDNGVVTKEATCIENGVKTYICTLCKATKTESIPKTDHTFTEYTITKDSTCTEIGEKTRTCKICNFIETAIIDKKEHSLIATSSLNSTCSTHGKIFYTCTICHNQIKTEELPLDSSNHSGPFMDSTIDPTCITEGKEDVVCTGCNKVISTKVLPKTNHKYSTTFIIDKNATCSKTGTKSKHCTTPGCTAKSEITTIPMTDHTKVSANNGVTATCTNSGKESDIICSVCKKVISTGKVISALGHSYDSGKITKEATCTTTGTKVYTCTRCKSTKTETIKALGHDYSTKFTVDKAATCSSVGSKSYHCIRCSAKTNVTEIPMKDHSWNSGTVTLEPTCDKTGIKTYTCTICKKATKTETIKALGHNYSNNYTTDLKPTCTKEGSKSRHCTRCGSKTDVTVIPVIQHKYDSGKITTEPTCTKTGIKTFTCINCGYTKTYTINSLGHNYSTNFTIDKQPTCTTVGTKSRHCTRCNSKIDITAVNKIDHTYESKVTKKVSCEDIGVTVKTCKVCGYEIKETTPALGHNYSTKYTVDKAATCTSTGSKSRHCTRCKAKTDIITIAKTDHTYTSKVTKEATCTNSGTITKTCTICGYSTTETIPALGHNYSSEYTVDREPTCKTTGSESRHCTRCSAITDVKTLSKVEHNFEPSNITKEPTCTTKGTQNYICKVCNIVTSKDVPALGHNYSSEFTIDEEPTCKYTGTKSKHCIRCGAKTDIIKLDKIDHIYSTTPTYTYPATCMFDGYYDYKCKNCSDEKSEVIPKLTSHEYDSDGICIYCGIGNPSIYAKSINIGDNSRYSLYANYKSLNEKSSDGTDLYEVIVKATNESFTGSYNSGNRFYNISARHIKPGAFANDQSIKSVSFLSNTINNVKYYILFNTDSCSRMFYNCKNLKSVDLTGTNISKVDDATEMFAYSGIENTANIKVTGYGPENCTRIFDNCTQLTDASSCNILECPGNAEYAFNNCYNLTKVDDICINGSAKGLFKGCTNLIRSYIFGVITNLDETYMNCTSLIKISINTIEYVNSMYRTFYGDYRLLYSTDIKLGKNEAKKLTNLTETFYGCTYLKSLDLSMISSNENITEMNGTFNGCERLDTIYTKEGVFTDEFISKLQSSGNATDIWKNCGTNKFTVKTE